MKKSFLGLMGIAMAGLVLTSCGDKYTPLTDEQKIAEAEKLYAEQSATIKAEKLAACDTDFQLKVEAKVSEMMAAAEATAQK